MSASKPDLVQGTLDMLVLQALATGPLHGYAIAQRIHQLSREALQVQQGSLYPSLHRLEERGFLDAEWRQSDLGRMAKVYTLTRKGRKHLDTEKANWLKASEAIRLVLQPTE
jgi:transcriptional regulator